MTENSNYFYHYCLAKSKARLNTPIGSFTNKDGNMIEEKLCEVLKRAHYEFFDHPDKEDKLPEGYFDSLEDLPLEEEKHLDKVNFSMEDIKK